jgi:hypothetical protein
MVKKFLLSQEFGNNIFTRKTISSFFDKVNNIKSKEIEIDFKDIEFISRSCADEYIKQKEKSNKKIVEANMSKDICNMFLAVKTQYEKAGVSISIKSSFPNQCLVPA